MKKNLTQKLIADHLVKGALEPGTPISLKIDQTLTQDATGTMVMISLEAMGIRQVETEVSAQYVDHNLLQTDHRNADDHLYLESVCQKFGVWYSKAGNGVSHPVHMERFGIPGKTLLGSDSHTPAAGSMGMLAIGAGGLDVAMAMAGEPYGLAMPEVWGVRLKGSLPAWVSAKDVILELLRRHGVEGGVNRIIEYHGPGLETLSAMDRHVIANMGTELGLTTSVFPSDHKVREFLASQGRENDWRELKADPGCSYDLEEEIDLSSLEPLIACPSSPGNVVTVQEVAGREVGQCVVGSSANPGYRDFAMVARTVEGRQAVVSLDINPTSRQIFENLARGGLIKELYRAGGRVHQAGCNGCIGMGQAPASNMISLRTMPRNFPGRSGTADDQVYLCSPETAAASALKGKITDPRTLDFPCPEIEIPKNMLINTAMLKAPGDDREVEPIKGPNIRPMPEFDELPDSMEGPVLLSLGDDVSTDEIMPAGQKVLPYRSNIPAISEFVFNAVDSEFPERCQAAGAGFVVAGRNYGQGSSREHAALAPRYLGLRAVMVESLARIHKQNLVNYGILPLVFKDGSDRGKLERGTTVKLKGIRGAVEARETIIAYLESGAEVELRLELNERDRRILLEGGRIPWFRKERAPQLTGVSG